MLSSNLLAGDVFTYEFNLQISSSLFQTCLVTSYPRKKVFFVEGDKYNQHFAKASNNSLKINNFLGRMLGLTDWDI